MHLGDWLGGVGENGEFIYGKVMLNDLGRLRVGDYSVEKFLDASGWELLRDFRGVTYQVYQFGNSVFGDYFQSAVKCPPKLMYEYENRVTPMDSMLWAWEEFVTGELIKGVVGRVASVLETVVDAYQGMISYDRPLGHIAGDAVFKSYYVVDHSCNGC